MAAEFTEFGPDLSSDLAQQAVRLLASEVLFELAGEPVTSFGDDYNLCGYVVDGKLASAGLLDFSRLALDGRARLAALATDYEMRRHGYGGSLLRHMEGVAIRERATELWFRSTPGSVGFYEKRGYVRAPALQTMLKPLSPDRVPVPRTDWDPISSEANPV